MFTTHQANKIAACGYAPRIAEKLLGLGMRRCTESLVKRQWDDPDRPSWYCLAWRWFEALFMAHRKGFDFLVEDFNARVAALRAREAQHGASDWFEQLAVCAREQSEALQEAIRRRDTAAIRRELLESIAAERKLVEMLDRPAHGAARKAA